MSAAERTIDIIVALEKDLKQNPDVYLIDGYTVTKKGRIRLRCASNEIRSICKELLSQNTKELFGCDYDSGVNEEN